MKELIDIMVNKIKDNGDLNQPWVDSVLCGLEMIQNSLTYITEEQIVDHFISTLTEEDKKYMIEGNCMYVDRTIRNMYGLWYCHPLTKCWRDYPQSRNIINGIDHSNDHPDAVSNRIYKWVLEKLRDTK